MADACDSNAPKTFSPTSNNIEAILVMARRDEPVYVNDCIAVLGENSIPLALLLFTLLSSLPLFSIPGFTTLTGIPIILLGGQLLFARRQIWLPKRIRTKRLKSQKLWHWLEKILPYLCKIEIYLKPRILVMSVPPIRYMLGLAFIVMGALLALPIPFINFPAGFTMLLLAVGLVERDGVLISIGLLSITLLTAGIVYTFANIAQIAGGLGL
ncbi:MAG: exopolysaccharide biosynthesis protein [Alphaproteobacteria bacterium]|nr:exopolysaccharide biosynthesis protein [Alphaproteobacteria bacterium]